MELREYIRILLRSWWLIIPMTMAAMGLTLSFSLTRPNVYESSSTHVIAFSDTGDIDRADLLYILDSLAGRQQIGVNFCSALTSGETFEAAMEALGVTDEMIVNEEFKPGDYEVTCNVLPESTVLLLIVTGTDPLVVESLNGAISVLGTQRAVNIYRNLVSLQVLDPVYLEPEPISPDHVTNLVLGTALGVIVSLTAALLLDYLRNPLERLEAASIRHPLTNAYSDRYFQKRMAEETERSLARNRPVSVALLQLSTNEDYMLLPEAMRDEFLHKASLYIQEKMRQGDIVAYRDDMQFEILLPETPGYEARSQIRIVVAMLRSHLFRDEQYTTSFIAKAGIVESAGEALSRVNLLEKAEEALAQAQNSKNRHVQLISTISSAFVLDEVTEEQLAEDIHESQLVARVSVDDVPDPPADTRLTPFPSGDRRRTAPVAPPVPPKPTSSPSPAPAAPATPFGGSMQIETQEFRNVEEQLGLQYTLDPDDPFFGASSDNFPYTPSDGSAFGSVSPFADPEADDDVEIATPYYEAPPSDDTNDVNGANHDDDTR